MEPQEDVISLREYLTVLRRQKWLIAAATVVTVGAAVAVSLAQTPLYEAQAEVIVEPVRRAGDVSLEQLLQPQSAVVETERLVVTSRAVADRAAEVIGTANVRGLLQQVSVEAVRDTRVVQVSAQDEDPVVAASIADAFATGYLDYRRDQAVDQLLAAAANLEDRAAGLQRDIQAIEAQIDDEDADEALVLQREALLTQLAQVLGQTSELGAATENVTGGGEILTPAEVPDEPVSPRPLRTGVLALVLGLLLGVGLAFLRDHMDDVIRDEVDFRRATGGRAILGRIPAWKDPEGGDRLATLLEPTSIASESFRELSAGVRFLLLAKEDQADSDSPPPDGSLHGRSIMVTSATAGDGKTSTAANLAVTTARVGLRTLLVDADMRRPTVAKRFGSGRTTGLSDLLLSGDRLYDHILEVGVDDLRVLPAGTIPPNPNELLASPAMRILEREILSRVDLVIYDTPAVLAVPDALELGRHVDLTIVVGRAGTTGRRQLASALERLQQVGTDAAGTVLNSISSKDDGYYYSYYYGESARAVGSGEHSAPSTGRGLRARRAAAKQREAQARATNGRAAAVPTTDERLKGGAEPISPASEDAADARLFGGQGR